MPASPCLAAIVAMHRARAARCRRAPARRGSRLRCRAPAAPRLQPTPATIMALSKPIASPASRRASRFFRRSARPAKSRCGSVRRRARRGGREQRLGLERHRVDHQAAAGAQRARRGVEHAGFARAAADEDGVGRRAGRRARPARRPRRSRAPARRRRRRCGGCAPRDPRAARSRSARIDRIGQHPLDRDRARAGADVPEAVRRGAAPATTASPRGFRAW